MIAKQDFDQLMNQARVALVGSSDAGLKGVLYDVLSEFFNDSSIWTQDVSFNALPNVRSYQLSVPEGQIIRLVGVATLPPPDGVAVNASTIPGGVFIPALMANIGQIVIQNAPVTATTFLATFVCNTSLPTDKNSIPIAPDWVLPVWHVGILAGMIGQMMMQPSKSYSNSERAPYYLKRFRDAIARARVSKLRANTNGAQAWRFPQQFRSVSQQGGVPAVGSASERSF